MCRLISAAVRANTSSRSSEAFTSSPISVSVASTSAEISKAGAAAMVVCSSVVLMRYGHYNRSAAQARVSRNSLLFFLFRAFFILRAKVQDTHIAEIAVALRIVQPVAHHELVGNLEANIIRADLGDPPLWLIQQHGHTNAPGLPLLEYAQQILQRHSRIKNILHHNNCLSLYAGVQVSRKLHFTRCLGPISITRDADEIQRNLSADLSRQIRKKKHRSFQHSHQVQSFRRKIAPDLLRHFANASLNVLARDKRANALLRVAFRLGCVARRFRHAVFE